MPFIRVEDIADSRLSDYRHVADPELLRTGAIFVAEGRQVVRTLVCQSTLRTRSVLLTEAGFRALADVLEPRRADLDIFIVAPAMVESLTGFNIHRGCLAIGDRPPRIGLEKLLAERPAARRLVVLDRIGNADNVGGIFRNAAAFGVDGVVLGEGCCDPLYRKAIRVSAGAALRVPFAWALPLPASIETLRSAGFTVAALTPRAGAGDISALAAGVPARLALLVGSEGEGLGEEALAAADLQVRIPMAPGVDSLNVSTATGIALHRITSGVVMPTTGM